MQHLLLIEGLQALFYPPARRSCKQLRPVASLSTASVLCLGLCPCHAGALSGDAMKAVHARVNELCRQLAADGGALALALCAGFGIPLHLLQVGWPNAGIGTCDASRCLCLQQAGVCPVSRACPLPWMLTSPGCPSSQPLQAPIAIGDWRAFQG